MPDTQDSRSLLIGRILRLGSEGKPVPGAQLQVGQDLFETNAAGMYELPLDGQPLPLRLTLTAPGFFQRQESVDWTPILPGGLLVRDFYLLENLFAAEAPGDPASTLPRSAALDAPLPDEAVGQLLSQLDALRALEPRSVLERSGADPAPTREEELPTQHMVPEAVLGAVNGTYIPPESLHTEASPLSGELDALLDRLEEEEEHILVSHQDFETPAMSEDGDPFEHVPDDASSDEGFDEDFDPGIYQAGEETGPPYRDTESSEAVDDEDGSEERWDDTTDNEFHSLAGGPPSDEALQAYTSAVGQPSAAPSEDLDLRTRRDDTWEFFLTNTVDGPRIERLQRDAFAPTDSARPPDDPAPGGDDKDDLSWTTSEWDEEEVTHPTEC